MTKVVVVASRFVKGTTPEPGVSLYDQLVVTNTRAAPEEANALLRELLQREMDARFGGNQTKMGKAIGLKQGTISKFLRGGGAGFHMIAAIAALAPQDVAAIIGLPSPKEPVLYKKLKNLRRAIELGGDKWSPRTVAYAKTLGEHWRRDREIGDWVTMVEAFENAHKPRKAAKRPTRASA
jgi:hypothetical protein